MKKVYKKPSMYIESFELTEHIAACGAGTNGNEAGKPNHRENACSFELGGMDLFDSSLVSKCIVDYDEDKFNDIFEDTGCYQIFGNKFIFAS